MILTRPTYQDAPNLSAWAHRNASLLARYFCDCDEAIRKDGGVAPSLNEWEWFVSSQYDTWLRAKVNDAQLFNTAQHTKDWEKDRKLSGLGGLHDD